ncbi:MAG: putative selenium-dependent hydroxylase accessory protein YqeC [Peptococcaceae bacterium]|nr:putative selenium-dependent hydroxylase accessory protein YqeC [Peptococcaceae bacterium]
MKLFDAFQIRRGDLAALVGAGGKTSAMFALGEEAAERGFRAVLTTTTRIYFPGKASGRPVITAGGRKIVDLVRDALGSSPLVVAGSGTGEGKKLLGVEREIPGRFLEAGADLVVVEADGAAGRPFKAPREWEPVIPDGVTAVIPVVGIDCLGRPLTDGCVHRPEMAAALTGMDPGRTINPAAVAAVFLHPRGYRKDVPPGSRWVPFINKVETAGELEMARELAFLLGRGGAERVVIGAARSGCPVCEVLEF